MKGGRRFWGAVSVVCLAWWPHLLTAIDQPVAGFALAIFGTDTVRAEVAATPEERARGLMFRDAVPEGTGMLFVFERTDVQGVWMKDTYVALDVAFLDQQFRVLNIEALEPQDTTPKYSAGPAAFALEVAHGWFVSHGVEPGSKAEIVFGRR